MRLGMFYMCLKRLVPHLCTKLVRQGYLRLVNVSVKLYTSGLSQCTTMVHGLGGDVHAT